MKMLQFATALLALFCSMLTIELAKGITLPGNMDGAVVYIQSLVEEGEWVAAREDFWHGYRLPNIEIGSEDSVLSDVRFKWRITYLETLPHGQGDLVAFESMYYPNMYLSSYNSHDIVILYETGAPWSDTASEFVGIRLDTQQESAAEMPLGHLPDPDDYYEYYFYFPERKVYLKLAAKKEHRGKGLLTHSSSRPGSPNWVVWLPPTSDQYITIDIIDNTENSEPVQWSYTATFGFEKTNSETISESLEIALSVEIEKSFVSVSSGLTYGHTWEQQKSETFSKSISKTLSTTVPGGKKIEVKQLIGHYSDSFDVFADSFKFSNAVTGENFFFTTEDFSRSGNYIFGILGQEDEEDKEGRGKGRGKGRGGKGRGKGHGRGRGNGHLNSF